MRHNKEDIFYCFLTDKSLSMNSDIFFKTHLLECSNDFVISIDLETHYEESYHNFCHYNFAFFLKSQKIKKKVFIKANFINNQTYYKNLIKLFKKYFDPDLNFTGLKKFRLVS